MKYTFEEKLRILYKYPEMLDFIDIIFYGVQKGYEDENWLESDGQGMSIKDNGASMFRHLANYTAQDNIDESGYDHRLHLACRALMSYTRELRFITHPKDNLKRKWQTRKTGLDDTNCKDINDHLDEMTRKTSTYFYDDQDNRGNR